MGSKALKNIIFLFKRWGGSRGNSRHAIKRTDVIRTYNEIHSNSRLDILQGLPTRCPKDEVGVWL